MSCRGLRQSLTFILLFISFGGVYILLQFSTSISISPATSGSVTGTTSTVPATNSGLDNVTLVISITEILLIHPYGSIGSIRALIERTTDLSLVIVCAVDFRRVLEYILDEAVAALGTTPDLSVVYVPVGLSEHASLIFAASNILTEWSILWNSKHITWLNRPLLEFLYRNASSEYVTGFCGIGLAPFQDHICVPPTADIQIVAHVLLPFILRTHVLQRLNITRSTELWLTTTQSLGGEKNDVGRILPFSSLFSSSWCELACQETKSQTHLNHMMDIENTTPHNTELTRNVMVPMSGPIIAVIMSTIEELTAFSNTICRLLSRFTSKLNVLVIHDWNEQMLYRTHPQHSWRTATLQLDPCLIDIDVLFATSSPWDVGKTVSSWFADYERHQGGFIVIHDRTMSTWSFSQSWLPLSALQVIGIPKQDLGYSEWIGTLSENELMSWSTPKIEISVVTNDRPQSLRRLLSSLSISRFFGDQIDLMINMEQDVEAETLKIVENFTWPHGRLSIHHRIIHGGLLPAVVESWYPSSNDTYAVILEDDVELSPLFYAWLKMCLLTYRYGYEKRITNSLFGISLYQQKHIELRPEGRRPFNPRSLFAEYGLPFPHTPYLSQVPCSWGALYFPEHWREFHSYLAHRFSERHLNIDEIIVPNARSNSWTDSWKKYFIELVYLRGYSMLYPNFDNFTSMSTNHLEVGSHVSDQPRDIYDQKKTLFYLPLMPLPNSTDPSFHLLDLPTGRLPYWDDLPVLDLFGSLTSKQTLVSVGKMRQQELIGCRTIGQNPFDLYEHNAHHLFVCQSENESD